MGILREKCSLNLREALCKYWLVLRNSMTFFRQCAVHALPFSMDNDQGWTTVYPLGDRLTAGGFWESVLRGALGRRRIVGFDHPFR